MANNKITKSNMRIDHQPASDDDNRNTISARLEAAKRTVLIEAIDDSLPALASQDPAKAKEFAAKTLEDIRMGNNPDLESRLKDKIANLGINLN